MASRSQYFAIKNALTAKEHKLIDYYELKWHLGSAVPTVTEVAEYLKTTVTEVNYFLTRPKVKQALDKRGVPWRKNSRENLSPEQIAAAMTVMNFIDTRSIEAKLDQLGIEPATYYAWQKDPQFKNLLAELSDINLGNIRPTAIAEFGKKVTEGDWRAIRYYMDASGELTNNDMPASEVMLRMLIEIIQKHVKDPQIISAIARDIELAAAGKQLETAALPPKQIVSYVEDDEELEMAKKTLGI